MVDDHLVHTIRPKRRPRDLRQLFTRFNVSYHRLIESTQVFMSILRSFVRPSVSLVDSGSSRARRAIHDLPSSPLRRIAKDARDVATSSKYRSRPFRRRARPSSARVARRSRLNHHAIASPSRRTLTRSRARLPHLQHGLQPVRHACGRHLSSALASAAFRWTRSRSRRRLTRRHSRVTRSRFDSR